MRAMSSAPRGSFIGLCSNGYPFRKTKMELCQAHFGEINVRPN